MYSSKTFRIKKEEEILREIKAVAEIIPDVRKVFLADGNPMTLSANRLLRILSAIRKSLPKVHRVSTYALPGDILSKTSEELSELRKAGLTMVYVGIESGNDEVLKLINKGETFDSTTKGLLKAKKAGIKLSVIIINGVGGLSFSNQHAVNSALILNKVQPEFASSLVLSFPYGPDHYSKRFAGGYVPMKINDLLEEMKVFINCTDLQSTVFRSNHASNYLVLKGILGRDKQNFLDQIAFAVEKPDLAGLRKEWQREL